MKLGAVLLLSFVIGGPAPSERSAQGDSCQTSPTIRDTGPLEPGVSPMGPGNWHVNADRSIWVQVPDAGWPAGGRLFSGSTVVPGQKTYWVRPAGAQLEITGRRLDASAPSVAAHIPCCYRTGFQIVGLFFPTDGCWEVTATAGDKALRFITQVRPAEDQHR